jgi:hypothetical protein
MVKIHPRQTSLVVKQLEILGFQRLAKSKNSLKNETPLGQIKGEI